MSASDVYEIYALRYGTMGGRTRQDNFRDAVENPDKPMPIDYFIWVVKNDDRCVVVDTGFDHAEAAARGRSLERLPSVALAHMGVNASLVKDVVVTHLHYDHAGTFSHFPSAKFHIQEAEMRFATGPWMLNDAERWAYSADHVAELVHRLFEKRVVFHDGDGEVAPGITIHCMPGHTMGVQAVRVKTKRGWVLLASDASHYYEHWVKRVPFAICWKDGDLLESYRRFETLVDSEDHVIPGHDPVVRSIYPAAPTDLGDHIIRLDETPLRTLRDLYPER
jgi:glyoxylase-like metal-dependent hydrolase (beta-lactamase superfamily II)